MSASGTFSTSADIKIHVGGYHEYIGECSVPLADIMSISVYICVSVCVGEGSLIKTIHFVLKSLCAVYIQTRYTFSNSLLPPIPSQKKCSGSSPS